MPTSTHRHCSGGLWHAMLRGLPVKATSQAQTHLLHPFLHNKPTLVNGTLASHTLIQRCAGAPCEHPTTTRP
jgi:hypothetical protein